MKSLFLFSFRRKVILALIGLSFISLNSFGQKVQSLQILRPAYEVKPLDEVVVSCGEGSRLIVTDSKGNEYFSSTQLPIVSFKAGGALGVQTVRLFDNTNKLLASTSFQLTAKTEISDGGRIGELFKLLYNGMLVYSPSGYEQVTCRGKTYRYFVNWVLDNNNTMKGMQYFSPYSRDLVDLMRLKQKPDGMIWSFVQPDLNDYHYYETAYSFLGYFNRDEGAWFVRQPNENHVEYNYVNMIWQHWRASGDNVWMKESLQSASRALDYCITDSLHWSKRFQLLKRPYCIDSWDFQVNDAYTPDAPLSPTMVVIPGKTKFGIFFGDNTGYYEACNQLAEMLDSSGMYGKADEYRARARQILQRLIALSWNGKYFTHFIEEDSTVKRDLGVDEKSQIAQGNMYSVNRGLSHDMIVSIINTYLNLRKHLPIGSPGEWYSIYPPFERGFGMHDEKWQYMNGGMAGHAMGELARGAFANGYEQYAVSILDTMLSLGKRYGNRVWFAYTGAFPEVPAKPTYKCVDISKFTNMDLFDQGGKGSYPWMNAGVHSGNDMRGLPTGMQNFHAIPFQVIDPAQNDRKAVIALSTMKGFPFGIDIPVNDSAGAIYLLHSSSDNIPSNVAAAIRFYYTDGTEASRYMFKGKEVTNWWFSSLDNERAGVAWAGPNVRSTRVGVCWAAIDNPFPSKKIYKLRFEAPLEGGMYALIAITLSSNKHYVRPKPESFGGPDNWAASNGMAALVEGLAGVKNTGLAFQKVEIAPRWYASGIDSAYTSVRFMASDGYVCYQFKHAPLSKTIHLLCTGNAVTSHYHLLLPEQCEEVKSITINQQKVPFKLEFIEKSKYVDFEAPGVGVKDITLRY